MSMVFYLSCRFERRYAAVCRGHLHIDNRIEEERQQSKKRARKVECEEAYKAKREKIEVLQFEKPKKN